MMRMELQCIMLSELSQEKDKYDFTHVKFKKQQMNIWEGRKEKKERGKQIIRDSFFFF